MATAPTVPRPCFAEGACRAAQPARRPAARSAAAPRLAAPARAARGPAPPAAAHTPLAAAPVRLPPSLRRRAPAQPRAPPPRSAASPPELPSGEAELAGGEKSKADQYKALSVLAALLVTGGVLKHDWVASHQSIALAAVFVLGYAGIIFEEFFSFNKSGVALLTAVGMWTVRAAASGSPDALNKQLNESLADVSQIVFFLVGAMTIVETVDAHAGFQLVTNAIGVRDKQRLVWLVGGITFFMSAILDNLTSTIVMVSLLRKLVRDDPGQRKMLGAVVVIAANAGGAWTPIGDVTTTMLWINGQISTLPTMRDIFLPAAVSLLLPLAAFAAAAGEEAQTPPPPLSASGWQPPVQLTAADAASAVASGDPESCGRLDDAESCSLEVAEAMAPRGTLVFGAGVAALLFVPVFKTLTGLPPYMGMLFGLGGLWLLTDAIHYGEPDRQRLKVPEALSRIDVQGVLFFLGILLSIASLESAGVLKQFAVGLDAVAPNTESVAVAIGLVSAVIDNVPLVAAAMGMYDLSAVPADSKLWQLIAYCAGTGGSILIIGSAAGVAFMGMERADFGWWVKNVTPLALAGYLAGVGVYVGVHALQAGGAA